MVARCTLYAQYEETNRMRFSQTSKLREISTTIVLLICLYEWEAFGNGAHVWGTCCTHNGRSFEMFRWKNGMLIWVSLGWYVMELIWRRSTRDVLSVRVWNINQLEWNKKKKKKTNWNKPNLRVRNGLDRREKVNAGHPKIIASGKQSPQSPTHQHTNTQGNPYLLFCKETAQGSSNKISDRSVKMATVSVWILEKKRKKKTHLRGILVVQDVKTRSDAPWTPAHQRQRRERPPTCSCARNKTTKKTPQ